MMDYGEIQRQSLQGLLGQQNIASGSHRTLRAEELITVRGSVSASTDGKITETILIRFGGDQFTLTRQQVAQLQNELTKGVKFLEQFNGRDKSNE